MRAFIVAAVFLFSAQAALADPSADIARGREQLSAGDCRAAAASFGKARSAAAALTTEQQRAEALTAIHFYTAMAHSKCGLEPGARSELKEFFRLRKGHSTLDTSRFDPKFATLFTEVQNSLEHGGVTTFERFYPGFHLQEPAAVAGNLNLWGASSEFQLLASDYERARWGVLGSDTERENFIASFWNARDVMRETEQNEFRELTLQRIRFADRTFPAADDRGALTDRGRVFVLLGAPSRVYRSALQRGQTTFVTRNARRPLDGQVESWIYFRPQLPGSVPAQQVEFRFITQPGYGDGVMQKEFMALKALEQARKANAPAAQ